MIEILDRIPTKPNRKKITPENGSAYYATVEYADEPTEAGTPINKATLEALIAPTEIAVFDTSAQWEVPMGVKWVIVYLIGGGGGGGGSSSSAGYSAGGGGGGGGYAVTKRIQVEELEVIDIEIGAGGAGGKRNADGGDGGVSRFGSYLSVAGGKGGGHGWSSSQDDTLGKGGDGGAGYPTATCGRWHRGP